MAIKTIINKNQKMHIGYQNHHNQNSKNAYWLSKLSLTKLKKCILAIKTIINKTQKMHIGYQNHHKQTQKSFLMALFLST